MVALLLIVGVVFLVAGAELLVRGASKIAAAMGIPSLIVGLTVVAFGTSAPEMAVSVASSLSGETEIAVGNVVGSNIFNVLFILGLSALIIPLVVHQKLIQFDVPLMVAISALVWLLGYDGRIARWEGGLLFLGIIAYTAWCIIVGRKEAAAVQKEYDKAFQPDDPQPSSSVRAFPGLLWNLLLIAGGLGLLVLGAGWLVDAATDLARIIGISELVIGLTIVAAGTSLPEVATSVVAAIRGERDIAVGNVIGSNIFNILAVLGLSAAVVPGGVIVAGQALRFDIPVMILVAVACLPIFFTGHKIARWEGALFFGYYVAYTVALVLMATSSRSLPMFGILMFGFVGPITVATLLVSLKRSFNTRGTQSAC